MPDREKVIETLEACVLKDPDDSRDCKHCPRCNYGALITNSCINGVMADALVLLKAQEPVKPLKMKAEHVRKKPVVFSYECPVCMCGLQRHWSACPICGKAVKWDG